MLQHNVQFLVQSKGSAIDDMRPYVMYMNHLLHTFHDAVSEEDRFELAYNDYLQASAPGLYVHGAHFTFLL